MIFRALLFGAVTLVGGFTFGQNVQRQSIPAMPGTADVSGAFDGGTCTGKVAFADGGCTLQLRTITEPGPDGAMRTLSVLSQPIAAACGQTVMLVTCPLTCPCPAQKPAPKPAPKKKP